MPAVVLTYDLHNAKPEVYTKLDELLKANKYRKVPPDTTWEATFDDDATVDGALRTTKNEFAKLAKDAGVKKYTLRVYAGDNMKAESVEATL